MRKHTASQTFDVIVLGVGGVGSAALDRLAQRGVRALGIERFAPGHDRGSSHGHTRIIRKAYFEHPDYVPLLLQSWRLWRDLEARSGRHVLHEVGLLQLGPADGEVVPGVLRAAQAHRLPVEQLTGAEVESQFPGFRAPAPLVGVLERQAGFLLVDEAVATQADQARRQGAELRSGETVLGWQAAGDAVVVQTDRDHYSAARLIVTAGPWSGPLLGPLGVGLKVVRKQVHWFRPAAEAPDRDVPTFLYELPQGVFYGCPDFESRGVKVAEHTGGAAVADPLAVDRALDRHEFERVSRFCRDCLPLATPELVGHNVCMYTMTADGHFIIDRHPESPQVTFVAGLSGHGFKFAPVLGEALAQLALDGGTTLPIGFLSCRRPALASPSAMR